MENTTTLELHHEHLASLPGERLIRVLRIEPAPQLSDMIQGHISIVDLSAETPPEYSALSYVWGEPAATPCFIKCGDAKVAVYPNCYQALVHLRQTLGGYTIWVDAICINQADAKEKESQIPLMGEIYAKSQFVYVWLGEGSSSTTRAIELLRKPPYLEYFLPEGSNESNDPKPRVWKAALAHLRFMLRWRLGPILRIKRKIRTKREAQLAQVAIKDFDTLLDTNWLKRAWTYQEILLASKPIIVCGYDHIVWQTFAFGVTCLEHTRRPYEDSNSSISPSSAWMSIFLARETIQALATKQIPFTKCPDGKESECILQNEIQSSFGTETSSLLCLYTGFLRQTAAMATTIGFIVFDISCLTITASTFTVSLFIAAATSNVQPKMPEISMITIAVMLVSCLCAGLIAKYAHPFLNNRHYRPGIDVADALLRRTATEDHDKSFSMRNIFERILKRPIPPPDYLQPLTQVYRDLNDQISETGQCSNLLAAAAMNHLTGHPSWMADWSKAPDPLWLRVSENAVCRRASCQQRLEIIAQNQAERQSIENSLILPFPDVYEVREVFGFIHPTSTSMAKQDPTHTRNLDTALKLINSFRDDEVKAMLSLDDSRLSARDVKQWFEFLHRNRAGAGKKAFQALCTHPDLFSIHTAICAANSCTQTKFYMLERRMPENVFDKDNQHATRRHHGLCNADVRRGDWFLVNPGGLTSIIIRPFLGSISRSMKEKNVRAYLISPAVQMSELVSPEKYEGWEDWGFQTLELI